MTVAALDPSPVAQKSPLPLFDRDLSWLEFNQRVLAEATNPDVPLLERVKFLSICSNNLDEFFMIRVGEVRDLIIAAADEELVEERHKAKLEAIRRRSYRLLESMYSCLGEQLIPTLKAQGIRIDKVSELGKRERAALDDYFIRSLEPILTPLAIDPGHPFPLLANLTLNLGLLLESERGDQHAALLKIPESLPRFYAIEPNRFVMLEDVIASNAGRLFPSLRVRAVAAFRVVRNSDLSIKEEDVQDLLKTMESELRRRDRREVVLIEIEIGAHDSILKLLVESTQIEDADVFFAPGPLKLGDLMQIYTGTNEVKLKDEPFNPRIPTRLASSDDIFSIIADGDILLHRPYDSFTAVIDLVQSAAEDPGVEAIKMTLYRTDRGSPIIEALTLAAARGKQVTAVVELQARFDERKNIGWARHLEQAGVQVVYGLLGIKTHCKACLVVRREGEGLRRYLHLSTGNYNAGTGRLYTDLDLLTCDPEMASDAAQLMNLLTGFTVTDVQGLIEAKGAGLKWKRLVVSPMDYLRWTIDKIDRETANAQAGKPAGIIAKMNALVEPTVIEALYRASRAGVKIDLLVRGICCLVPGVPGVSETIDVMSVVDRFLEHSRVFRFVNGGEAEVFIASGDWMPRNFIRRIEAAFPVLDPNVRRRIEQEILPISMADNVKGWTLDADGKYHRRTPGDAVPIRSQEKFIEIARADSVRLGPYEEIISRPGTARRKAKKRKKQH
ncbi:MAG: polyphosphate kinase 1 [Acidobacteria bacterium]|nr:polyphosphate kinase 1 [Acidobacteriota bacterium]